MSAWVAGSFAIRTAMDSRDVVGWLSNDFAMDFRVFENDDDLYGAWHLTHLATGYSVCHFKGADFARAVVLVDDLRAAADWSFSEASGAATAVGGFADFKAANLTIVRRGAALLSSAAISPIFSGDAPTEASA